MEDGMHGTLVTQVIRVFASLCGEGVSIGVVAGVSVSDVEGAFVCQVCFRQE